MDLKKFHVFFIIVSALLCAGLAVWGIWDFKLSREWGSLVLGIVGILGLGVLFKYLRWFLEKYKNLHSFVLLALVSAGMLLLYSPQLIACPICYQDSSSPQVQALWIGVGFLLAIIVAVLVSIVIVVRGWLKRAQLLQVKL